MRRRRGHGARDTLLVLALGVLAVVAALAWLAEHLMIAAGIALLIGGVYYAGRHGQRCPRLGQARPPRRRPDKPAAGPAAPMVTLPRTDPAHGQDEAPDGEQDQLGTRQPASVQAGSDRTRLLAAPMSGVRDLWGPS